MILWTVGSAAVGASAHLVHYLAVGNIDLNIDLNTAIVCAKASTFNTC